MNYAGSMLGRWLRLLIVFCKRIEYEMNMKFLREGLCIYKNKLQAKKMHKRKYLLIVFCSDKLKIN